MRNDIKRNLFIIVLTFYASLLSANVYTKELPYITSSNLPTVSHLGTIRWKKLSKFVDFSPVLGELNKPGPFIVFFKLKPGFYKLSHHHLGTDVVYVVSGKYYRGFGNLLVAILLMR